MSRHPTSAQVRDDSRTIIVDPDTGRTFVPGETSNARTIYAVVGFLCAVVLATALGFRAKTLKHNVLRKGNFTSILVLLLFFFSLGFILSTSIVETGQSLRTHDLCYTAAIVCLVFYTGTKLTIYVFLLERARIVRSPFISRLKDVLWIPGIIITVGGFGSIAIIGYLSPVVELSPIDGRCRIGLPVQVSFPLLSFDVGVNCLLTAVFIWLLRPVLSFHGLGLKTLGGLEADRNSRMENPAVDGEEFLKKAINRNIKTLLWKSLIGSCAIMLPTVANMAQFYIMKGRELGWICLTICTLDISWGVLVINWLTVGSAEVEANLTSLMSQLTVSTAEQPLRVGSEQTIEEENVVINSADVPVFIDQQQQQERQRQRRLKQKRKQEEEEEEDEDEEDEEEEEEGHGESEQTTHNNHEEKISKEERSGTSE
ncbi:hypothetical protein K504DRAFT_424565 [Pleomassaria siparia CBS 279.74]|uniref:G-protein coupled receptors family 1 profile domain-containing protein n=1 Tax=Pleomassaria siparia CBS 279.74 TaxID=1314801 RepID=A0A6G1KN06_9PLEO|nr:hypothetical protein K504DRAFT_424565 [Pleomassaria siparia CBS 279.74]